MNVGGKCGSFWIGVVCCISNASTSLVLCLHKETSLDYHPKNSNWNHFENYSNTSTTTSPFSSMTMKKDDGSCVNEEEDGEDEDFLWSEPPRVHHRHFDSSITDDSHNNNDNTMYDASQQYTDNISLQSKRYNRRSSTMEILHSNANCLPSKLIMVRHGTSQR